MHSSDMNWVDYGIIVIMAISILVGISRGFVREAMSLITWVLALVLGTYYFEPIADSWFIGISVPMIRYAVTFVLLVLMALIIGGILTYLIGRLINSTKFNVTDRIIGTLFGFGRGAIIVALLLLISHATFFEQFLEKNPLLQTSVLIPKFDPLSAWMKEKLPDDFLKIFSTAQKLKEEGQEKVQPIVSDPLSEVSAPEAVQPLTEPLAEQIN